MNAAHDLEALAKRVEAAAEPNPALFLVAFNSIHGPAPESDYQPRRNPMFSPVWSKWTETKCRFENMIQAKAWLDAAILLVPEDAFWRAGHDGEGPDPSVFKAELFFPMRERNEEMQIGLGYTAALAICAASLRALSQGVNDDHA